MKLKSHRLITIYNQITKNNLIDVGTDHGLIPLMFAKSNGDSSNIQITDINQMPLEVAKNNFKKSNINNFKAICTDGLENVNFMDEQSIVIAGMGGLLIRDILENSIENIRNQEFILQPNNNEYELRKFLNENGFIISDEIIIEENDKIYEIIISRDRGNQDLSEEEIKFGPHLLKERNEIFINKYMIKLNNLLMQINKITDISEKNKIKELITEYEKALWKKTSTP